MKLFLFGKKNNSFGKSMQERAHGKSEIAITNSLFLSDHSIKIKGIWSLPKWDWNGDIELQIHAERLMQLGMSFEEAYKLFKRFCIQDNAPIGENLLLNAGINRLQNLLCGAGGTAYNNVNARIGVGDSATAAVASQTGLQAVSNKTYTAMDATFPTSGSSQQSTWRCTVVGGNANYHWQEFVVDDNGSPTTLNRLVSDQGTKTSGQSWQPSLTLTIS